MYYELNAPITENALMTLTKGGVNLRLNYRWHEMLNQWRLSIADALTGESYIDDIPLLCGADLLKPFQYKGLGELYILPTADEPPTPDPTRDNLATDFMIVWGDGA